MEPLLLPWMIAGKQLESGSTTSMTSGNSRYSLIQKGPQFRLISYSSRDFAEMTRLTFAYAGVEFEDCKIEDIEKWNEIKHGQF